MKGISLSGGVVMAVLLMAVAIFFDGRGTVNAQETEYTPSEIARMEFMVNTGDTCWDLAVLYAGSGQRCPELVAANPERLTFVGTEDPGLEAGMILNVPVSWFTGFLGPDKEHEVRIVPLAQTAADSAILVSEKDQAPTVLITGLALGSSIVLALGVLIYVIRTRLLPRILGFGLFKWPPDFLGERLVRRKA